MFAASNAQCVPRLDLQGPDLSPSSAKSHFSGTDFPGMHFVGFPLLLQWTWRADRRPEFVCPPMSSVWAVWGGGVCYSTPLFHCCFVPRGFISWFHKVVSVPQVCEEWLRNILKCWGNILLQWRRSCWEGRELWKCAGVPTTHIPGFPEWKRSCDHLSLSEGTLYGLWATCRFSSSRDASQYLEQCLVCGWGLSRRILYEFGFWLVFLWVLFLKFLFNSWLKGI